MLDKNALSQLKSLKTEIEASKEYAEARVKGTQARYGFAVLDDGREIFLPPDEMLKVFPDDVVRVCIQPDGDGKLVAEVLKLIRSEISEFTGCCVCKGKAVFIEPDLPRLHRWLFIPPHARNGIKQGDFARAAILRHPMRDGRPQAKVLKVFGNLELPGIECEYAVSKFDFDKTLPAAAQTQLDTIVNSPQREIGGERRDISDFPFVTIDSARTLDIDDALFAETTDFGWHLYVAIADPSELIEAGSALDQALLERGVSLYLPGEVEPMIPAELTQNVCALAEGESRPALVCKISISDEGGIVGYEFFEALVRSSAKLSYAAVDRYVSGGSDELMAHSSPLEALYQSFRTLRVHRTEHELVMEDRVEYRSIFGDNRKIERIEVQSKLQSQKLVEECMIAANRCAADFLVQHDSAGPFITHQGFRSDRTKQAKKLFKQYLPECAELEIDTLAGYRELIKFLAKPDLELPFRSIINRMLARAGISDKPENHMGMSLPQYTNVTSPLRKYTDLLVHRQIKSILRGTGPIETPAGAIAMLVERVAASKLANRETDNWLKCQYAQQLIGQKFQANISHINSSGFNARIQENGIEGNVDLRKHPDKFSFDPLTAALTSVNTRFFLEQELEIIVEGVALKNKVITFQLTKS
ncbi:MAG: VacB/RNase II family 3'-5' exoribonuclease [Halieaceae bacterium]|jgi:VacB/RNase II family 3'-5' exoribonuclease